MTIETSDLDNGGKAGNSRLQVSFLDGLEKQPKYALKFEDSIVEKVLSGEKRVLIYNSAVDDADGQAFYVMNGNSILGAVRLGHGFQILSQAEFDLIKSLHCEDEWVVGSYGYRVVVRESFDSAVPVYNSDSELNILEIEKMVGVVETKVWKSAEDRIVAAAVLVPGRTDLHDEIYDEETVRAAAYYFMENYLQDADHGIDVMHDGEVVPDAIRVIQSFVLDEEKEFAVEVPALDNDHPVKNQTSIVFPKGTWIMYARVISDTLWEKVKNGEFTGWSIAGLARVTELRKLLRK